MTRLNPEDCPEDRGAPAGSTRTPRSPAIAYLALGSNLGDRARALESALERLDAGGAVRVRRVSSIFETEPLAAPRAAAPAPWYLNRVVETETLLAPEELLTLTQGIEVALGRAPARSRWAPREIDIDILLYGTEALRTERLTIPHAGLTERRFVLEPLAELAPALVIPRTGRTVAEHLNALADPLRVLLYAGRRPGERG